MNSRGSGIFSKPAQTIENRTAYTLDNAELNLFETRQATYNFHLRFNEPVIVSMIRGKKIMHLREEPNFDFYPGQTIIMPSEEDMNIDFPSASFNDPTQCLALTISPDFINNTLEMLNEYIPKAEDFDSWFWVEGNYHLLNDDDVTENINRIINYFVHDHFAKSVYATHAIRELIIKLLQTKAKQLFLSPDNSLINNHRLAFVINYIRKHLTEKLTVEELSNIAYLSKAHFFRVFQNEIGMSPVTFINKQRVRFSKNILSNPKKTITDACYQSGFNNLNYYCKVFKSFEGTTPGSYKKKALKKGLSPVSENP